MPNLPENPILKEFGNRTLNEAPNITIPLNDGEQSEEDWGGTLLLL
jgi:hypothetical protein